MIDSTRMHRTVRLTDTIECANHKPLVMIAGINVLESAELAFAACEIWRDACAKHRVPYIFKASFDKANRSRFDGYRGPGIEKGLQLLADIKSRFSVPVVTDIHEPKHAPEAAEVVDMLQIPAFLARQTDLIAAAARTGAVLHIKKPQFIAPDDMQCVVEKCAAFGNDAVLICERGTSFGYRNLVVDMLGVDLMKAHGVPITVDVTHALQLPGIQSGASGGRGKQCLALARAACAVGVAGIFVESHPQPEKARCDGASALPFADIDTFLLQVTAIDRLVKQWECA